MRAHWGPWALFIVAFVLASSVCMLHLSHQETGFRVSGEKELRRQLSVHEMCDRGDGEPLVGKEGFKSYFKAMKKVHKGVKHMEDNCVSYHENCGFTKRTSDLPLLVLSVGLEGAGHHLWTEVFKQPVFDCVWTNARHYNRDIGAGVPRQTPEELAKGFYDQMKLRVGPPCKFIYDAEDSFPTGAIRARGRLFMRPDLINLAELDGKIFDVRYLLIVRNTTDTVMSSLRRNFFVDLDSALRTVEHTLTYIESALKQVSCGKVFVAHYEHVLADPAAYVGPLSGFLGLPKDNTKALQARLMEMQAKARTPTQSVHELRQFRECGGGGGAIKAQQRKGGGTLQQCYAKMNKLITSFLKKREFMWPNFAGNGYLWQDAGPSPRPAA